MRYLVRSKLSRATASSGRILAGRIDSNRAMSEPYLRNLVEKAAIGSEQERVLAADDPCVEVGNRHRRRTDGRLAVDLGVVALVDVGVIAAQPDAADRKSAVAPALRDCGLFQKQQRAAAGSEIDELRRGRARLAAALVLHLDAPAPP